MRELRSMLMSFARGCLVLACFSLFGATRVMAMCGMPPADGNIIVTVPGGGTVTSLSGNRDCAGEQTCDFEEPGTSFSDTFTANPAAGYLFAGWSDSGATSLCQGEGSPCAVSLPAAWTDENSTRYLEPVFELDPQGMPNILVIMADDLGYNDLAINNGNPDIDTPHMDQLAQEGVRFTRHYASQVCSPTRAAFLTGRYPERIGYLPNGRGISPEIVTLPDRLQEEGYTTWHIGKWHIGDLDRIAWPDYQGFDHWFGFLNQFRLAGEHVNGELQLGFPRYEDPWLEGDTEPGQHYLGHLEDILTDHAISVMSDVNSAQSPWFLNLWFYAPHGPISPAPEFAGLYPDTDDGRYRALVNQLDYNIGRVLAHLEAMGAAGNTIVVMVSDNGGAIDRLDNNDNNAPYYGFKTTLDEGGLRTPMIIKWPGDASLEGVVFSDIISIRDIYPTLLESIGVSLPQGLDGQSYFQVIQQLETPPQRTLFWEKGVTGFGVLSADGLWRYYQPLPLYGFPLDPILFDLGLDPTGSTPVFPIPPAQQTAIVDSYADWYGDVHFVDTTFTPDGNGGGVVTGMDMMRTPGFGPYTFGIGIGDNYSGQIAAQDGIWDIGLSGNTVMAQFGDLILSGDIDSAASCHSIVVTGSFSRQVSNLSGPDTFWLSLYIDGQLVQSGQHQSTLSIADLTEETVIGDPGIISNDTILEPIIMNRTLGAATPLTLASFSQDVCATMP